MPMDNMNYTTNTEPDNREEQKGSSPVKGVLEGKFLAERLTKNIRYVLFVIVSCPTSSAG